MREKGQALVEFVIILPVVLLLILGVIDFGRIVYEKNNLESIASDVVTFYKNGKTSNEIENIINSNENKDIKITITNEEDYVIITVNHKISPIAPGISKLFKKAFDVSTKRVIYNE